MGSQYAVSIASPPFRANEWRYLPQQQLREDYGYYRVLQHLATGQKIDEYEFLWPNQEELNYYLKSYNWRCQQPNVVNTRFIEIHNQNQFCSRTFTARVYIQHVKLRLSDISDIPYPDNLYVLMEALEGYSQIFQHSKFFYIEENQICVDEEGNIKIWVNGDLSINYPNVQGHREDGEEEMVDNLIDIIADNTDAETEPSPTFRQYFDQKRGPFGKKFEEAKVLVMSYARINNINIPGRFEAIFNMEIPEQSVTQKSSLFSSQSVRRLQWKPTEQQNPPLRELQTPAPYFISNHNHNQVAFNQNMSFGNSKPLNPLLQPNPNPIRSVNYIISNMPSNNSLNPAPLHPYQFVRPVNHLHQRTMQERVIPHTQWAESVPFRAEPVTYQAMNPAPSITQVLPSQNINAAAVNKPQAVLKAKNAPEEVRKESKKEEGARANFNFASDDDQDRDMVFLDDGDFSPRQQEKRGKMSKTHQELFSYENEEKGFIAMSLPISPHLQKKNNKELTKMMQQDKAVQSHIDPNQLQTRRNGPTLNEMGNNSKKRLDSARKSRDQKMSLKYYSSLYNELQIDPEIAADLAKYVGR